MLSAPRYLTALCRLSAPAGGWEQGLYAGCETCNGWRADGPLDRLHYCSSEQRLSESATRFRSYLGSPPGFLPMSAPDLLNVDNPMVGHGVISQELLEIQLVAFLLAGR